MKKPSVISSLFAGLFLTLLLTAPLLALMFLAQQALGLAFIPFDVFGLVSRILPGSIITTGIDGLVRTLGALGLSVRDTAKVAEQGLAVGLTLGLALLGGMIYFLWRRGKRADWRAGLGFSAVVGVLLGAVSATRVGASVWDGVWVFFAVVVWGLGLTWLRSRVVQPQTADTVTTEHLNRRQFIVRVGGAAAVITVAGAGVGAALGRRTAAAQAAPPTGQRWSASNALPNADAAVKPVPGTRPEYTPLEQYYRIDITLSPPVIQEADWNLRVEGLVDNPKEYTLADLRAYAPKDQFITMECISNPLGGQLTSTTRWTGVPLQTLLIEWGLQENASHLRISSADGFFEYLPLEDVQNDERIMLAYAWDGVPLRFQNGFPLRVYWPDHYGMKQPKWIESIEVVAMWEPGYWVLRSWNRNAVIKSTSVIDTVGANMMLGTPAGQDMMVPVGGIAFAGARGVSKVEVKVDDGAWQEAEMRTPISELTWVVWRFDWPFEAGEHTFTVRCTDGDGKAQVTKVAPPHPNGSTGLDSRQVTV